ncbi:MAG: hypothetical protein ACLGG0_00695 [Bacteriovoracia bacterium]
MKKHLVLGAALAVLATPAFATKARLVALGEDIGGSQYINDNRNIFLNSAHANNYKDTAIFELGGDGAAGTKADANNNPQAEGGVLYGWNNMVAGAYFGGESASVNEARGYLVTNRRVIHQDNQLDLFLAGESSVKWGANLTYSQNKDDTDGTFEDLESQTLSARLGVIAGKFEAFANVSLINSFEGDLDAGAGDKEEFKGKLGYELGGTYRIDNQASVFAFWRHAAWEQESSVSQVATTAAAPAYTGEADAQTDRFIVGYGRETKLNDKATLFYKVSYVLNKRELDTKDDGKATIDDYAVPVVVGLEVDAASWLTLRGSISQSIINEQDNDYDEDLLPLVNTNVVAQNPDKKRTKANTTSVRSGATLKFGDFAIDGLLMTSAATATNNTAPSNGILNSNRLLARVAMTYKF